MDCCDAASIPTSVDPISKYRPNSNNIKYDMIIEFELVSSEFSGPYEFN